VTEEAQTGVGGTVGAFNFIRRVGFPGTQEVLSAFATIVVLSAILALPLAGMSVSASLRFAFYGVVIPVILGEALNTEWILRDKVLNFRRMMGLEILSWFLLIVALPVSAIIGSIVSDTTFWIDGFFVVLAFSLPVRFLTIGSITSASVGRKLAASALPPILVMYFFSFIGASFASPLAIRGMIALGIGVIVSAVGVSRIIQNVEHSGAPEVRDSPMTLFRVFLQHWLKSDPEPLEARLGTLGKQGTIEGSILSFSGTSSPIGCVVVSNFHPGPYRDLGSGSLPASLKASVEKSVGGVVQVPHSISNHELNIVSHRDVQRVIEKVVADYPHQTQIQESTPMVQSVVDEAKVSGQLFGEVAFLTLTLSPTDMEDLPPSVSFEIEREAITRGFTAVVADAHNSLSRQTSITSEQARKLVEASIKVLDQLAAARNSPFKAGSAEDPLEEFRLEDGIGPGGLSSLVVQNGNQIVAYLTIDGNNMKTGAREAILEAIETIGVSGGEVMTTDTHLVTGLVRSRLGYYPVGAHLDVNLLIQKIKETVQRAIVSMQNATAGYSNFSIEVGVLGSETFQTITDFIGGIGRRIARQFYLLEAITLVATLVVLFFP
jgi:predicted neutral ceramidase superfamily lipid hydrolase